MNPKKKESLFLGSLFLAVQCLCMVKGDVHFYDFVVSTSYRIVSFCSFILKITVTDELPLLALVFPCAFFFRPVMAWILVVADVCFLVHSVVCLFGFFFFHYHEM